MSSPTKPRKLTKAERKAAAALRRPNPANPPRDNRAVKFSTAEDNVRRVNERYARLKYEGKGEEVELMRQRDEIAVRLREIERNMIENGRTREEVRVMAVEARKDWLDGLDEEDRKNGVALSSEEEKEKCSPRASQTNWELAVERYNSYRNTAEVEVAAQIQAKEAEMHSKTRWRQEVIAMPRDHWAQFNEYWPEVTPQYPLKTWVVNRNREVEMVVVGKRVLKQKEVMGRAGKTEDQIQNMEQREWMVWDWRFPMFTGDQGVEEWAARPTTPGIPSQSSHLFAIEFKPQGVDPSSSASNESITEYAGQRDASKAVLDRYLQQLPARMFAEGRSRSAIQDAVAGAQTRWHLEWPYVPPGANMEVAKKWLYDYKAGVERKKVEAKIKLQKEVMIRIGKPKEEIRDMEEKAWIKWRAEFPEDAYLVDQEIGIKPMATTGLDEAGAVPPGFATWEKICWIYNKRRDVSKQVFERSLAGKIQGMRCAKWSEFEISKALEPDWGMRRGQWPEVDTGDEERGRRVWETYRGKQRMVMEKQIEVKRKVMAAAGKTEAEIEEILNKGWGKWRNEFPEIWSADDGDDEDEFETERQANKFGEIEVIKREVEGENEKGEIEVDESVYDTDTEGGVDLRYSKFVYDTDTDTEGGVDLGAWDGYDD